MVMQPLQPRFPHMKSLSPRSVDPLQPWVPNEYVPKIEVNMVFATLANMVLRRVYLKNWDGWWLCNLCNLDFHTWKFSALDLWILCNQGFQMSMFRKLMSPWCLQPSQPWSIHCGSFTSCRYNTSKCYPRNLRFQTDIHLDWIYKNRGSRTICLTLLGRSTYGKKPPPPLSG